MKELVGALDWEENDFSQAGSRMKSSKTVDSLSFITIILKKIKCLCIVNSTVFFSTLKEKRRFTGIEMVRPAGF